MKSVQLTINGMTCSACARNTERVVSKNAGISDVTVNFATEKAFVRYDPRVTGSPNFATVWARWPVSRRR